MIDGIHERDVFLRLAAETVRGRSGPLSIVITEVPGAQGPCVAFAVPRKVGSAVVRNRLRRQLRAAATELAEQGRVGDDAHLVVVRPGARGLTMSELRSHLANAVHRAHQAKASDTERSSR